MSKPTGVPAGRRNPKAVGEISEAFVLARLIELGYPVALPFGNNQRYDFIVDDGGFLSRVQVKTGRLYRGAVGFPTCSTNGFTGEQRGYLGEADEFLVYCPETNEVYRIPVADCGPTKTASLRVDPIASEKQSRKVRWARDHILNQAARWRGRKPLAACVTVHPGSPPRVAEKATKHGVRRYCKECNRTWEQQALERRKAAKVAGTQPVTTAPQLIM